MKPTSQANYERHYNEVQKHDILDNSKIQIMCLTKTWRQGKYLLRTDDEVFDNINKPTTLSTTP